MADQLTFDIAPEELEIFLEDVNECLHVMESGILHLEQKHDAETLNSIFRGAHTLKALAGMIGHRHMADLAHALETIFDDMRQAKLLPRQAIIDELLTGVDILKTQRDEIVNRQPGGVDIAALLTRLRTLKNDDDDQEPALIAAASTQQRLTVEQVVQITELGNAGRTILEIEIVATDEAFASAARLYQAAAALLETGQIVAQHPALDQLTEADKRLWLILATSADPGDIESLLLDMADLAEIRIRPYVPQNVGQANNSATRSFASEEAQAAVPDLNLNFNKTVRISVERLDMLMNLVGELVTNRTHLLQIGDMLHAQYGKENGVGALNKLVAHFSHVVDQLQDEVMQARMLPIATLFKKFPRLVRDAARSSGKQVNLIIEGESTELDRTIIEVIGDPLIHLLRNAVDHGLETPEARLAAGKTPVGTIRLTAASVKGQIVITVADDGRGIDPTQIRQAALNRGLLPESGEGIAQPADDDEIVDLIFQPNLSTVTEVTEMSGRGVGLDVVRTNIEQLNGSVVVRSQIGRGTTFQLTMPLTLALVQSMLVTIHHTLYAIPVISINGAFYLAEATPGTVRGKPVIEWQGGGTVPLLDLREFFARPKDGVRPGANPANELPTGVKPAVVLVTWGKLQVGLVVDKIIGQQEIVVKALNPMLGSAPGLSGATILGDGHIALIIDIAGLINAAINVRR